MYCRKCHRHSDFRANFCRFCGAPLGTVENCGLQPPLKEYETFSFGKKMGTEQIRSLILDAIGIFVIVWAIYTF